MRLLALVLLALPASAAKLTGDPVLWKVSAPGKAPTYLFGTIHVGITVDDLDPAARAAFAESPKLVTETYDAATPPPVESLLMDDGRTLPGLLSKKGWATLEKELSAKVPKEMLAKLKPGVAYALLEQKFDKFDSAPKLDRQLLALAKEKGKTVDYLETPQQQADFLDRAVTPKCLDAFASRTKRFLAKNARFAASYRRGEPDEGDSKDADCEEISKVLNLDRTAAWTPRVEDLIRHGGTFLAVGCLHLVGPEGLVERLKAKGWIVERVKSARKP